MANWNNPTISSVYSNLITEVDARLDDCALQFPSTGTYSNLPTGTISFRSDKWQKWNGSAWADLATTYAISITGTASNITGTLAVAKGGTNITSYTVGDILYASAATTISKLAAAASGNVLLTNGVGVAPSWGKVGLATHVSGTLPVANGGTGVVTLTGIVKGNGTGAFSSAVAGTDYLAAGVNNTGNLAMNGSITTGTGLTVTSGGISVTSGNLTLTSGSLTMSNGNLSVAGSITSSGAITAYSDARLKSDVVQITDALDLVQNLRGVKYIKNGVREIGVIAQEIETVLPEVVLDGEYKSVAYGNIIAVLIEAIKELNKKVDRSHGH